MHLSQSNCVLGTYEREAGRIGDLVEKQRLPFSFNMLDHNIHNSDQLQRKVQIIDTGRIVFELGCRQSKLSEICTLSRHKQYVNNATFLCLLPSNKQIQYNLKVLKNIRGGSIMVGALRQTTWWGPLVVVRKKNVCVKSDVFKTRQI